MSGTATTSGSALQRRAWRGLAQLAVAMGLCLFLPAGTWRWPEAWVFIVSFTGSSLAVTLWVARHDPALLERRLEAGPRAETRPLQKVMQAIASLAFVATMIVPALEHRRGGARAPAAVVLLGEALVILGFWVVFRVFRENSFASATIEVSAEQKVIETGPYAWVRHPMYAGALVLVAGIPPALGSVWGLLTLLPFAVMIVTRLLDEEALLARDLPGYVAYRARTRYRLIPRVW